VTYGDVFLRAEREYSAYNFEHADTAMLTRHFADAERNAPHCWTNGSRCRPTTSASRQATCSTCSTRAG
jgi:glycyl-tRNA synthetase alpha subunit